MENTFSTGMDCVPKNLMLTTGRFSENRHLTSSLAGRIAARRNGYGEPHGWHGILWTVVVALSVLVGTRASCCLSH